MLFNALGRAALGRGRIVGEFAITADVGVLTLTGNAANLTYVRRLSMSAEVGTFTLTGQATKALYELNPTVTPFVLTGRAAGLTAARFLYPTAVATITTSDSGHVLFSALGRVALGASQSSSATASTTFILGGVNVEFVRARTLTAGLATYTLTFISADLDFAGRPPHIRAFPRVSKGMRTQQRGASAIVAKAGGGGIRARSWGG